MKMGDKRSSLAFPTQSHVFLVNERSHPLDPAFPVLNFLCYKCGRKDMLELSRWLRQAKYLMSKHEDLE